jgi:hypothetical protein
VLQRQKKGQNKMWFGADVGVKGPPSTVQHECNTKKKMSRRKKKKHQVSIKTERKPRGRVSPTAYETCAFFSKSSREFYQMIRL